MFKGFTKFLEKSAFWFIFFCVSCLVYSVLMLFLFGSLPRDTVLVVFDVIAILWCYFAGTLPILYIGLLKVKSLFDTHE